MDEQEKQRLMISAIGFGMTVIIYQALFNGLIFGQASALGFVIAIVLGGVVGAATYFGLKAMGK